MIEVELTEKQVDLLMSALKLAEGEYTNLGYFDASKNVGKLHSSLYRQIFTYGQVDSE